MKPQSMVVPFWSPEEVETAINGTLAHLAAGKVLAYPTETVYGFGGALDERSLDQLVNLKGRPPGKPFLLLVAARVRPAAWSGRRSRRSLDATAVPRTTHSHPR